MKLFLLPADVDFLLMFGVPVVIFVVVPVVVLAVVLGFGQYFSTFFSVRVIVLLESYWEPSDRRIVSRQLKR